MFYSLTFAHMTTFLFLGEIVIRLRICVGDTVRMLKIINILSQRVRERSSLAPPKLFTPKATLIYLAKFVSNHCFFLFIKYFTAHESVAQPPALNGVKIGLSSSKKVVFICFNKSS